MRDFSELSEREVLALAIGAEEEDFRIYMDLAERLREEFSASSQMFMEMAEEETEHRHKLLDLYQEKFGNHIPLIRRQDIRGFLNRKPIWQLPKPSIEDVRNLAESMETETKRFYRLAASRATDVSIRKLLGDLAEAEQAHEMRADAIVTKNLSADVRHGEDVHARQLFLLQYIQPGLVGLMDGSVSTPRPHLRRRLSPRTAATMPFWSEPPPRWVRASPWVSPRPSPMTVLSLAAAHPIYAAWSPAR